MLKKVAIIGAGTMGSGIAQWFAQSGVTVELCDVQEDFARKAHTRILESWDKLVQKGKFTKDAVSAFAKSMSMKSSAKLSKDCDLVVEAIIENLDVKKSLFTELDKHMDGKTIFASNTSSLTIASISAGLPLQRKKQFLGLHFFNPAPIMELVEVITVSSSDLKIANDLADWFKQKGKAPALCQDSPGFIVNRVARNFYGEALRIAGKENIEEFRAIDKAMREAGGFKMGPFELMDLIGIDVNYEVTQSVWKSFFHEPRFAPHPLQKKLVESGRFGKKSGEGFYAYES